MIFLLGVGGMYAWQKYTHLVPPEPVGSKGTACTLEARICPNCEFAPCPTPKASSESEVPANWKTFIGEVWIFDWNEGIKPSEEFVALRTLEENFGYYGLNGELLESKDWERFKKEAEFRTAEIDGEEFQDNWPPSLNSLPSLGSIKIKSWKFIDPLNLEGEYKILYQGTRSQYSIFKTIEGKTYVVNSRSRKEAVSIPEDQRIKIAAEPASKVWHLSPADGFIRILEVHQ